MTTYTGTPDECSIHWPHKLSKDGLCDIEGCPMGLTPEEAELDYQLQTKNILRVLRGEL